MSDRSRKVMRQTSRKEKQAFLSPPPGQPWIWLTRDMLESPAYRALSRAGHQLLARLMIEHCNHAGKENGRLAVSWDAFQAAGLHRSTIAQTSTRVTKLMAQLSGAVPPTGSRSPASSATTQLYDIAAKGSAREQTIVAQRNPARFRPIVRCETIAPCLHRARNVGRQHQQPEEQCRQSHDGSMASPRRDPAWVTIVTDFADEISRKRIKFDDFWSFVERHPQATAIGPWLSRAERRAKRTKQ